MNIQNIVLAGTPILRHIAQPVKENWFGSNEAKDLLETLFATMKARQGAGLAAPQINIPLRVLVYGFQTNTRYPDQDPVPFNVLINPEIVARSVEKIYLYEGCLSLPELRGFVPRHEWVEIRFQDPDGGWQQHRVTGFEARIVQHEIDHLDGKLYPERMDNMRTLGITAALKEAGLIR